MKGLVIFLACFVLLMAVDASGQFVLDSIYYIGNSDPKMFATDFDLDGDIDIATGEYGRTFNIFKNYGDATFEQTGEYPWWYGSIEFSSDFDGDGDKDLALGGGNGLVIGLNSGDGTFIMGSELSVESSSNFFAADLDGDGDKDLITGMLVYDGESPDYAYISIYLNDGNANFTFGGSFNMPASRYPDDIFVCDLDNDGDNDIAVASGVFSLFYYEGITVYLNNGNATFQDPDFYPIEGGFFNKVYPRSIFASDFNGDGYKDLTVACKDYLNESTGMVTVHINNGAGRFYTPRYIPFDEEISEPYRIIGSDYDNDGDMDIIVNDEYMSTLKILVNDGSANFSIIIDIPWQGNSADMFAGDFDRDGDDDLAAADERYLYIYTNQTNPPTGAISCVVTDAGQERLDSTLIEISIINELGDKITIAADSADANGECLIPNLGTHKNYHLKASRNGYSPDLYGPLYLDGPDTLHYVFWLTGLDFLDLADYPTGDEPRSVIGEYFNEDTFMDLAVANGNGDNVSMLMGNGNGTFQPAVNYPAGDGPRSVCAADLNGDSRQDLAVADANSDSVAILLNNGDGTFSVAPGCYSFHHPAGVDAADFDGDGDIDLAVANYESDNLSVIMNNGDGTFGPPTYYPATTLPQSVFAGDFDGDSDIDLAVACGGANTMAVWINNGSGVFQNRAYYPTGDWPWHVYGVDYDCDGDMDLMTADYNGGTFSTIENNGNGTFTGFPGERRDGDHPRAVFPIDYNNDGNDDLVVAYNGPGNGHVLLWQNYHCHGAWYGPFRFLAGEAPSSIFAADFNRDGNQDMAVANMNSDNVSILINQRPPSIQFGTIAGTITETDGITPIPGVVVRAIENGIVQAQGISDYYGFYSLPELVPSVYGINATKTGYFAYEGNDIEVTGNDTASVNIPLLRISGNIGGMITESDGVSPIDSVEIMALHNEVATSYDTTDTAGQYFLPNLLSGLYDLVAQKMGYEAQIRDSVEVAFGETTLVNFALAPAGPACAYVIGDANGNGGFNGLDVVYSVSYFKGGPLPPYSCECTPGQTWYVAGDVNASCNFNGLDVSYMVTYFKGGPTPNPCADCPPPMLLISPDPIRIPAPPVEPVAAPILIPKTQIKTAD